MAEAKHTPGPWEVWKKHLSVFARVTENTRVAIVGQFIVTSDDENLDRGEVEANIRLIAAAPELLEAAEAMVVLHDSFAGRRRANTGSDHDPDPEYIAKARAAVAKAVGR